jgi:hypothetical protein
VEALNADGAHIDENEDFMAFVHDTKLSGEGRQEAANGTEWATEVRNYLAGINDAEHEGLIATFRSHMTALLAKMYTDRANTVTDESAIERSLVPDMAELEKIMRYENHLSRQVERKIEMLMMIQEDRREREGGGK